MKKPEGQSDWGVFKWGSPVDDAFPVQVLQAAADLRRVEDRPVLLKTCLAHVVDVKLQVAAVHQRQHEAQGVLRLVGVRQTDLSPNKTFRSFLVCVLCF